MQIESSASDARQVFDMKTLKQNPLDGLYFNTTPSKKSGAVQGRIMGQVSPDLFLIEVHNWVNGRATHFQRLISVNDLWTGETNFYHTANAMRADVPNFLQRSKPRES